MEAGDFPEDALVCNDFLGGRVRLWQPRRGYRAGIDPVLLAASVPARRGETVLELGCGAGPAMCCLAARVPELDLVGVERQAAYATLARRNAMQNTVNATIVTADLTLLPVPVSQRQFHHVMANPPYFDATARTAAIDPGREAGLAEDTPLSFWVATAARRTRPGGSVTMIHRASRLPDLLAAFCASLGAVEVLPLSPRADRDPKLVLVRGRQGGRAAFRLHKSLILHEGHAHPGDREHYRPEIRAVLRDAAALGFAS
ncbi:tRNA1(Val) (adenine(37)-N6)-methyltransferase [Puniceibacterium sp. IMCC21224]|uniref:tRNA1(Val) (adenine(37)-N6)-methyltransferase n=1 Tax=Puniceibacterium sp. IMCC21224 TaxID=1618204 RepID=UPI00064DF0E7|nr:methyltransferase [Puniceibacterium sp. IMCC21224]KMK66613.1 putative O-methyltransferase [Puniceibacterium sp. IMCC21224]